MQVALLESYSLPPSSRRTVHCWSHIRSLQAPAALCTAGVIFALSKLPPHCALLESYSLPPSSRRTVHCWSHIRPLQAPAALCTAGVIFAPSKLPPHCALLELYSLPPSARCTLIPTLNAHQDIRKVPARTGATTLRSDSVYCRLS